MKTRIKLSLRKVQHHIPQFVGLMLLIFIGSLFFVTVFTLKIQYERGTEQYFTDYAYADITYYGMFSDAEVATLRSQESVFAAEGRIVEDMRVENTIFRVISTTSSVNNLHLYDGRLPQNSDEGVILKRNASAMDISIGDTLVLGDSSVSITGIVGSPEYVYMVKDQRNVMADPEQFGVIFVEPNFFSSSRHYNEIVALGGEGLAEYGSNISAFYLLEQEDQPNSIVHYEDVNQIETFAYIFPIIFAILVVVIIWVMVSRAVQKERRHIGVMKALGSSSRHIAEVYVFQFGLSGFFGSLLGALASIVAIDIIIGVLSSMFVVPTLEFTFFPTLWVGTIFGFSLLCVATGVVSVIQVLHLLPSIMMSPKVPKGKKSIFIERFGFWKKLSFNTRYGIKNSLRNKGRFFTILLGMVASCGLMVFSIGFYTSIDAIQDKHFTDFVYYDAVAYVDTTPLATDLPIASAMDNSAKALLSPVMIEGESYTLYVVDTPFNFLELPNYALDRGVVVPEYLASFWGVEVGDTLKVGDWEGVVSATVPQYLGLAVYTGYKYVASESIPLPQAYNTVFAQSSQVGTLQDNLDSAGIQYTTQFEDRETFSSLLDSLFVLVAFMIGCSLILGVVVLYATGLITLASREYEYMFMGIMGFPHKSIMLAHAKEAVIQMIISIPLGFLLGNLILQGIKGQFSSVAFVVEVDVYPIAYIVGATSIIIVTAIMALVTSIAVSRLDIVQGLKVQDD